MPVWIYRSYHRYVGHSNPCFHLSGVGRTVVNVRVSGRCVKTDRELLFSDDICSEKLVNVMLTIKTRTFPTKTQDTIERTFFIRSFYAHELELSHAWGNVIDRARCFFAALSSVFCSIVVFNCTSHSSPLKGIACTNVVQLALAASARRNSQSHFRWASIVQQIELGQASPKIHRCCIVVVSIVGELDRRVSDRFVHDRVQKLILRKLMLRQTNT